LATSIGYRRVSATIVRPSPQFGHASRQVVTIDPQDQEAGQEKDAVPDGRDYLRVLCCDHTTE
jgi:hypothetical protein